MPVDLSLAIDLLIAMGIGGLIGIEREHRSTEEIFAGSRTLPLVALLGAVTNALFPGLLLAAFILVFLLVLAAYLSKVLVKADVGATTAVATVLTFVFGAMVTHSETGRTLAVVLGALTTVVLAAKTALHGFAERIEPQERKAMLQFLLVALVIAPLLPDERLDLLLGLNPRFIWLMVVFISGIGLLGYLLSKRLGARQGIGIAGLLGGIVSSTATTVSMATRSKQEPDLAVICGLSAALASIIMLPRILLEVAVVNRALLWTVALPIGLMTAAGALAVGLLLFRQRTRATAEPELSNPFRLRTALIFAGLFAVILLAVEHLHAWLGEPGVYLTAMISGLADVDAITLSMSRLALRGDLTAPVASLGIVIAAVSNTLVKVALAWIMGTRKLGTTVTLVLGGVAATGILSGLLVL